MKGKQKRGRVEGKKGDWRESSAEGGGGGEGEVVRRHRERQVEK